MGRKMILKNKEMLRNLYANNEAHDILYELSSIMAEHSENEWKKGNCKYSLNISVVSSILEVIAKDITFNYRLVTREDLEEIKDNIKYDIEEILL